MGRSIYCSKCKKEKGPGRENESCCKLCKSEAGKARRAAKRLEAGMNPLGSGRDIHCYSCKAVKENPKSGYCLACNRKRDNERRLATGVTKKHQTGLCPCGAERAPYNPSYCVKCASSQRQKWLLRHPDKKKEWQDKSAERNRLNYVSTSQGRIRRKGSLINGEPVLCSKCDQLTEGWCEACDLVYWWRKQQYQDDPGYANKVRTRALTRANIKAGKLIKQPCEVCGENKVEAHHDDYTQPMQVRWLCKYHHTEHHSKLTLKE